MEGRKLYEQSFQCTLPKIASPISGSHSFIFFNTDNKLRQDYHFTGRSSN